MKKYYYSKLEVRAFKILLILIWTIAIVSVFFNLKYSAELIEKEQKINTLIELTEVLKEKSEEK